MHSILREHILHTTRQWILDYSLFGPAGQFQADELMARWMTSEPVRSALHVMDSPAKQWPMIDEGFDYTSQYAACNPDAAPGTPSMIDFYREIAPKLSVTVVGPLAAFPLAPSPSPPPSPSHSPRRTHSILEEHILSRRTGKKFFSGEQILFKRTHSI